MDGQLSIGTYPSLAQQLTATIGGNPANVAYQGAASYLVSGVFQINVYVPAGT